MDTVAVSGGFSLSSLACNGIGGYRCTVPMMFALPLLLLALRSALRLVARVLGLALLLRLIRP